MSEEQVLPLGALRLNAAMATLVDIREAANDMRAALPLTNDPRHSDYFGPLMDLIDKNVASGLEGNLVNIPDTLLNIQSALRRQPISARDEEMDARTPSRKVIAGCVGTLRTEIDNALEAFTRIGMSPSNPGTTMLIVSGQDVPQFLIRLDERLRVNHEAVLDLERVAHEIDATAQNSVKQASLVDAHVDRLKSEIATARFETTIANNPEISNGTDFNVLTRAVEAIGETTRELNLATKIVSEYFAETVQVASATVVRAGAAVQKRYRAIVRVMKGKRPPGPPVQAPPQYVEPEQPFDLNVAHTMILDGLTIPDAWVPQILMLDFKGMQISDLSPLMKLTSLQFLQLANTPVTDLRPLRYLPELNRLNLSGTKVEDLRPLKALKSLRTLILNNTLVVDLAPLRRLANLEYLDMSMTKVVDVSSLRDLPDLKTLSLANTLVSDVTPLRRLKSIQILRLSFTPIKDISPLTTLLNLQIVYLDGTTIKEWSPVDHVKEVFGRPHQWFRKAKV
jgi:hypothetical protein